MKPVLILDNHFRLREELFRGSTYAALSDHCTIVGGANAPMPRETVLNALPDAHFYVASHPRLSAAELAMAPNLRATIEVAGAFRDGLDYHACFERGIDVLSCSPGFRNAVAEMCLAMMLSAGRGLIAEHEAFRTGNERWLDDRVETDFSLFGETVGFIGYGQISRQTTRLLAPFSPKVLAYDPFVDGPDPQVTFTDLDTLVSRSRVVVVAAVPSEDTRGLLTAQLIKTLRPGALVVVISRAWCTDFPALVDAALAGDIRLATDVFPDEPLAPDHPLRRSTSVILSPHRAAAVPGGRQLIGDMILHDVRAMLAGRPDRQLKRADKTVVDGLVSAQRQLNAMPNT